MPEAPSSLEREGNGFVAGLVTGALIGASLAMVFSPVTGGEMREILQTKVDDAAGIAKDALDAGKP